MCNQKLFLRSTMPCQHSPVLDLKCCSPLSMTVPSFHKGSIHVQGSALWCWGTMGPGQA